MKLFKNIAAWVSAQFRTHLVRSLIVSVSASAIVTMGILWACGVFSGETYTYLPNRTYILAETPSEPQTLDELLHSDAPSVETLLKNPQIAEELLSAENITDIVDSRMALNNLRSLDRQLDELLAQEREIVGSSEDSASNTSGDESASHVMSLETGVGPDMALRNITSGVAIQAAGEFAVAPGALEDHDETLTRLKNATEGLLSPVKYDNDDLVSIPATMNMKGVWQSPDEALIHMIPSGDWLPENGYKLYRLVNGQSELIASEQASPAFVLSGNLDMEGADLIRALYEQAMLTPDKLATLGMTAEEFRDTAYRCDPQTQKPRVGGELDFIEMKNARITIPAGMEQKIPLVDLMLNQPIFISGSQGYGTDLSSDVNMSLLQKFSVNQIELISGITQLKYDPAGAARFELARDILTARQQLATLSFVNREFAEKAGFLIRDDLRTLNLPNGTTITYAVETPDGRRTILPVTKGVENRLTKPQGLLGYGMDGKVPLRWAQPQTPEEKNILSGYLIERKLNGEHAFKQINAEPIVVSYILDETGVYFETPVFFEDTVENGRTATYRIRSIDVFGRMSEYSDPITVKVEKVTPPNSPSIDVPVRSDDAIDPSPAVDKAIRENSGKRGIVLPMYAGSADTVRFTIYRAVAVGAQRFGPPEILADISYNNPAAVLTAQEQEQILSGSGPLYEELIQSDTLSVASVRRKGSKHLLLNELSLAHPDLTYFDADVEEGRTYKYWVSAWDSWNNESVWSQSATAAIPTSAEPGIPGELTISMHLNPLPDLSGSPPGLIMPEIITYADLDKTPNAPARPRPEGAYLETTINAKNDRAQIGNFLSGGRASYILDESYGNLPDERYIHMFVAVRGEDVLPDGTARLKWPVYTGDGLGGYVVYSPLFQPKPLEEMQGMSRTDLLRMGRWSRVNELAVTQNQLMIGGLTRSPGSIYLFLVCLEPEILTIGVPLSYKEDTDYTYLDIANAFKESSDVPEGGYVYVDWELPEDPQAEYFRIYRSEVPSFKKPIDESALEWTLVGDYLKQPKYIERVDQSFAHYYYYKVTSVSPWGVESSAGRIQRFKVPATKPPETPNLLLPLSRKDGVQINFSAVSHCDRYEIYRAAIPTVSDDDFSELLNEFPEVFTELFETPSQTDAFMTGMMEMSLGSGSASATQGAVLPASRFKTIPFRDSSAMERITSLGSGKALATYNRILDTYGSLALADYRDLSEGMLGKVIWTKVGELQADEDTTETVDPATGLLKPLSIIDTTARYGVTYLYTVQAWNDDNLGSSRPEPVEATPRRNRPFDPIDGLTGDISSNVPSLSWNPPRMSPLTLEECLADTVGYIVYRSDNKEGPYYQASPLLFETWGQDTEADPFASNWYRVKVLDTGGYLSEFSEPILLSIPFASALQTVIPEGVTNYDKPDLPDYPQKPDEPPSEIDRPDDLPDPSKKSVLTIEQSAYSIVEGNALSIPYSLTGAFPITVLVEAEDSAGNPVKGFSVDKEAKKVNVASTLQPGVYYVNVLAVNQYGDSMDSFTLTVSMSKPAGVAPVITVPESSFSINQGTSCVVQYGLTGTEPITVTASVTDESGNPVKDYSLDASARRFTSSSTLAAGTYYVTLRAKNDYGESTDSFTIKIASKPVIGAAPRLEQRGDGYAFSMIARNKDLKVQLSASGTPPLTWTLEPVSQRMGVPPEASIDNTGLLTVSKFINAGNYRFIVRVTNAYGSDSQEIVLTVTSLSGFGMQTPLPASFPIPHLGAR